MFGKPTIAIIFVFFCVQLKAQQSLKDSIILSQDDFLVMVLKNHPLVKQAELLTKRGDAQIQKARGNFDPYFYNYFNQKQFDDKNYYSLTNGGLKIPTWYGLEGKIGYDNSIGEYINPENRIPTAGLISAGVSASIGKGLFIDQRRAQLKQAKLYAQLTEVEQFLAINTILYQAVEAYWEWVKAYNHFKIYENAVELAKIRFESVKISYYQGAEPAIDTLEAFIQLQTRTFGYNEASLEFIQTGLILSNFIWAEDETPLELSDNVFPPEILDEFHNYLHAKEDIESISNINIENHPVLQSYDLKIKSLQVDRKYKIENLKPKLNVNYNLLNEAVANNYLSGFSSQNYKWGIEFQYPLLLRQERAEVKLTKIKLQETSYDRTQKMREINNKIESIYQELKNLEIQEQIFTRNTVNYERLLYAEKQKFELGESSLFLINSREIMVIESQIKLIDIRGKYRKTIASLLYSSGMMILR